METGTEPGHAHPDVMEMSLRIALVLNPTMISSGLADDDRFAPWDFRTPFLVNYRSSA